MNTTVITDSPLGSIFLEASNQGLLKVIIGYPGAGVENKSRNNSLTMAIDQIRAYFSGDLRIFTVPLDLSKLTAFQQKILNITRSIPFGEVRSYGDLTRLVNKPGASQAVGMVMKKNPMPIIIPCHRVVASDGKLHGYSAAGGLITKAWLLELEGLKVVDQRLV